MAAYLFGCSPPAVRGGRPTELPDNRTVALVQGNKGINLIGE